MSRKLGAIQPEEKNAVFSVGTASSANLQLARDIAILNAKTTLADRIDGRLNSLIKQFVSQTGANDFNVAIAQDISKTVKNVILEQDVSGYTIEKNDIQAAGSQYNVYVLLKYSNTLANDVLIQQIRKNSEYHTQLKASKAYQELEDEIEKNRNQTTVQ